MKTHAELIDNADRLMAELQDLRQDLTGMRRRHIEGAEVRRLRIQFRRLQARATATVYVAADLAVTEGCL